MTEPEDVPVQEDAAVAEDIAAPAPAPEETAAPGEAQTPPESDTSGGVTTGGADNRQDLVDIAESYRAQASEDLAAGGDEEEAPA